MAMTYLQFETEIRARVWPEGEAENLIPNHKKWVLDAIIDLQKKVPCLQSEQMDIIDQCLTYYFCGTSVFTAPRGFLRKLYTIEDSDGCSRVDYDPISKDDMDCLQRNYQECNTLAQPFGYYYEDYFGAVPFADLPVPGFKNVDDSIDKTGRAARGYWTLDRGNVYIFPHMQWNESAVLTWDGLKRSFGSTDEVDWDREVEDAVEYYVGAKSAEKEDCDFNRLAVLTGNYSVKVSDLIYNCKKERRLPKTPPCFVSAFGSTFCNTIGVYQPSSKSSSSVITQSTTTSVREVYGGASPPTAPDDPTRRAIFINDDGSAWLAWNPNTQQWE